MRQSPLDHSSPYPSRPANLRSIATGRIALTVQAAMVLAIAAFIAFYVVAYLEPNPHVTTDKPAYVPYSTVHVIGTGMNASTRYDVVVVRPDGSVVSGDAAHQSIPPAPYDSVVSDSTGAFGFDYLLTNVQGFYTVNVYRTSDTSHLTLVASTVFEDAIVVDLDQCSDGAPRFGDQHCDWQNGDLNASNSQYAEAESIPYRYDFTGMNGNSTVTHSFDIQYDFSNSGIKAFDFLTSYNATQTGADPCSGSAAASSLCPGLPLTPTQCVTFPSDLFLAPILSVAGAEAAAGLPRCLGVYNAITGSVTITGPIHDPLTFGSGNGTATFHVTFRSSGSTALFVWGGHLANSQYWGVGQGATSISGAPFHMSAQSPDGNGNKSQNRSVQISAVSTPTATNTATFTSTPTSTNTPAPTSTATNTATATVTSTATPTATRTNTPVPPTATFTSTSTATNTPTATATNTSTSTPTVTSTSTATSTPTSTATATATNTPTPVPTATNTPTNTAVPPTATFTSTATSTPTATNTATPVPTATNTPTNTPVPPTATFTNTATATATGTPTSTATSTPTNTATATATNTATATSTSTSTPTNTATATNTATNTPLPAATATNTATSTSTNTATPVPTATGTPPPTSTSTPTGTATSSPTITSTPTITPTPDPNAAPVRMVKDTDGNVNEPIDLANLWLCKSPAPCLNNGEGHLDVSEMVLNVGGDPDGVGAFEFQVKYDNHIFDIQICEGSAPLNPDGSCAAPVPGDPAHWLYSTGRVEGAPGIGGCAATIITENDIRFGCVSKNPADGSGNPIITAGVQTDGIAATIHLLPKADLVNRMTPGNNNGAIRTILDEGCEVADIWGHPLSSGATDALGREILLNGILPGGLVADCADLTVTVRILEGDMNLDCAVTVADDQIEASHFGAMFGNLLYQPWYDLEPAIKDGDVDIKDLQKVFGRNGSMCAVPVPPQNPEPGP